MAKRKLPDDLNMDEDTQLEQTDYVDPVIVKIPLKTPDDVLRYWNHRLETVRENFYLVNNEQGL